MALQEDSQLDNILQGAAPPVVSHLHFNVLFHQGDFSRQSGASCCIALQQTEKPIIQERWKLPNILSDESGAASFVILRELMRQ